MGCWMRFVVFVIFICHVRTYFVSYFSVSQYIVLPFFFQIKRYMTQKQRNLEKRFVLGVERFSLYKISS